MARHFIQAHPETNPVHFSAHPDPPRGIRPPNWNDPPPVREEINNHRASSLNPSLVAQTQRTHPRSQPLRSRQLRRSPPRRERRAGAMFAGEIIEQKSRKRNCSSRCTHSSHALRLNFAVP
jgi:hypothetical protein